MNINKLKLIKILVKSIIGSWKWNLLTPTKYVIAGSCIEMKESKTDKNYIKMIHVCSFSRILGHILVTFLLQRRLALDNRDAHKDDTRSQRLGESSRVFMR